MPKLELYSLYKKDLNLNDICDKRAQGVDNSFSKLRIGNHALDIERDNIMILNSSLGEIRQILYERMEAKGDKVVKLGEDVKFLVFG